MAVIKHIQNTLTPIKLKEGMPGYETVLDIETKLDDPEVFNIAVTGPYGSGKSTVLKSLIELFPEAHHYLTISLASLTGDRDSDEDLNENEKQKIEFSILQQLIYKEKPRTLPMSRFRRLVSRSVGSAIGLSLSVIAFILSFFIVFEPSWLRVDYFYRFFNLNDPWNGVVDLICSGYMLIAIAWLIAIVYRRSIFSKVKAFNVKDVSIELNQDSSVFNKHLEEIIYFFESTNYDVVIIEDLDRFRCPEIFQKLREINYILKQSEVLKKKDRRIKFIYAIKDDLFKDAERTKFFDYIATVTPIVNPKNSCEKLKQELDDRGYTINKETLSDLCEYVDDMRMLKNVANEFQQYMERLTLSSSPNPERLLAMIIYKNHHPDDFGDLHFKKGRVYECLRRKPQWIQLAIDKVITPNVKALMQRRDEIVDAQRLTLRQWRVLYLERYRHHLSQSLTHIIISGENQSLDTIIDTPELFDELIKQRFVQYRYIYYGNSQSGRVELNFANLEQEVDDHIGYVKRKELSDASVSDIDAEILEVREEESRLRNYKLARLLVQFPEIKDTEEFLQIGLSPLMIHFLERGYIDETYYDYLTIFDGTTMSLSDRELLSRIKQNSTHVGYDETIDDPSSFVNEIPLFVFEYKSVLNYAIADELLTNDGIDKNVLKAFESHFVSSTRTPFDFLAQYYRKGYRGAARLWKTVVKDPMSWRHIQTYEKREYWDTLVEAWLKFCDSINITDEIRTWLNNNLGFCVERVNAIGKQHLVNLIEGCKFVDITSLGPVGGILQGDDVMEVADHVLGKNMYELTDSNIFTACVITSSPFETIRFETVTLTNILDSSNDSFKEYVMAHISEVFDDFISKSEGQEEQKGMIAILNEETIDATKKMQYLVKQVNHRIESVNDINRDYRPLSIRAKVLRPSWKNVLDYYAGEDARITGELEYFVNSNVTTLVNELYPEDSIGSAFATDIMYGSSLNLDTYRGLLPILARFADPTEEKRLSECTSLDRVESLVQGHYLSFNPDTATYVDQFGDSIYADYLKYNIVDYISCFDDYDQNPKAIALLLSSSLEISISQRWALAKRVPATLVSTNVELADSIMILMWDKKTELDWPVVESVMARATPNEDKRRFQERLIKINKGDIERVKTILRTMVWPYSDIIKETKKPLIPKPFKKCLDIILSLGLISSYREEEKGYRVYHSMK